MTDGPERLERLLGDPQLGWLLKRVRRRLELGRPLTGSVTLAAASAEQRQALERLFGRRPRPAGSLTVSLEELDRLLRGSGASPAGLAAAVTQLTGPVTARPQALEAERLAWEQAFVPLEAVVAGDGELTAWRAGLDRSGVVKRLEPDPSRARELLERLAAVVAALPAEGEPLGGFAARVAGEAHALDPGRALATLALGAARALAGLPNPDGEDSPAEARREAWGAVGVLCDELSSSVLTIGLPGDPDTACGRLLEAGRASGEPVLLTLRSLVRDPPRWAVAPGMGASLGSDAQSVIASTARARTLSGVNVRVCENPVVVSVAAERLGERCAPLLCTRGQPGAAVMLLLRMLSRCGATLSHHGDFDWGGLRIANLLHTRLPITPWRFDADVYLRVLGMAPAAASKLTGTPVHASWSPRLTEAMIDRGLRLEEEHVLEELLLDLASYGSQRFGG